MAFTLPPSLDKIFQQQHDDRQALEKANAPRSQSRWKRWNILAREKIHNLVEKKWASMDNLFATTGEVWLIAVFPIIFNLGMMLSVGWAFKIFWLLGLVGVCVFVAHFSNGVDKMKLKDRVETSWGKPVTMFKKISNDKTESYTKTLLTQQQYIDLLQAMKQNAITTSNLRLGEIAQHLIDTMDTTAPYFATLIAEKIEEEYKINAWSVVEATRNTVNVEIEKGGSASPTSKNNILKI